MFIAIITNHHSSQFGGAETIERCHSTVWPLLRTEFEAFEIHGYKHTAPDGVQNHRPKI